MNSSTYGRCPICTEELSPEGDILVCPSGDYRVNMRSFLDRWDRYFEDTRSPESKSRWIDLSMELLEDLQRMKIRETE